ncbi:hypothetical protein SMD44_01329 [Streptomyces alboflavus]|uniref:Uncharacterized protein n=1 Tax=Streptomyces alboflavus TaxID=67267 RepID=A0A1Z1W667_9ACTN|nr:hypothetical protein [Streptomyces alboflavus]ARX81931.1 hypothetical protein SMD44_01329 [Streptomyces alboflavus]
MRQTTEAAPVSATALPAPLPLAVAFDPESVRRYGRGMPRIAGADAVDAGRAAGRLGTRCRAS